MSELQIRKLVDRMDELLATAREELDEEEYRALVFSLEVALENRIWKMKSYVDKERA